MLLAGWGLLGLVVLLAVPVDVAFRLERIEALEGQLTVRWMFGLVKVRLAVPRARRQPVEPKARPKRANECLRLNAGRAVVGRNHDNVSGVADQVGRLLKPFQTHALTEADLVCPSGHPPLLSI